MRRSTVRHAAGAPLAALATCLLLAGCGAPQKVQPKLKYPPPPEKTRVVFLRSYTFERDLRTSSWQRFVSAILPHGESSAIRSPTGVALSPDETKLYVATPHAGRIVVVDVKSGKFGAIGASGGSALGKPYGVAVDGNGNVYAADMKANAVVVFDATGKFLRKFGEETLRTPMTIAVDPRNQIVYVVNDAAKKEGSHSIEAFSFAGKHLRTLGGGRSDREGFFQFPRGLAVSRAGELFVADMLNFRVQVFDSQGNLVRMFGQPGRNYPGAFDKAQGLAFDTFGNIYVADMMQGIHVLNDGARALMIFGQGAVQGPIAIAIDSKNHIYVADYVNRLAEFELVDTKAEDSQPPVSPPPSSPAPAGASPASTAPTAAPTPDGGVGK